MSLYPVFLDLHDAVCLVVGAGAVGCRRASSLLEAGVRELRLVDPCLPDLSTAEHNTKDPRADDAASRLPLQQEPVSVHTPVAALLNAPAVRPFRRMFLSEDVNGCCLVCAATDVPEVNVAVAAACRAANIFCTVADTPEAGSCRIPARLECGGIMLALTTGGGSPALAARIKMELAAWLTDRYDQQIVLLTQVRPLVLHHVEHQADRAEVFRQLAGRELGEALRAQDYPVCVRLLQAALPVGLHVHIAELLHELA